MLIRIANESDIPELVAFSKPCFEHMDFREEGNDWELESATRWIANCVMDDERHIVLVATQDGVITGTFFSIINHRHAWHRGKPHACELFWHADPALSSTARGRLMIALHKEMESQIIKRGIKWFHIGTKPIMPAPHEYLLRNGYHDTDIVSVKELLP